MRRRTLLTALATLTAGCLGAPSQSGNPTSSTTQTTTTTTVACENGKEPASTESEHGGAETDGEFSVIGLSESTTTDGPSVKYVLEPSAFYSRDAVTREDEPQVVEAVSDIDDDEVRDAIETAVQDGEWRSDSLPGGLAETVERVDFFTGASRDDTHTHIGLTLHRLDSQAPPAIEFDVTLVDGTVSAESPGVLELELANTSSTTQQIQAGTVPPFGTVFARSAESDERFLLWRPYEEEGCVSFQDERVVSCSIGVITTIEPCERISRRYEVLPSDTSLHPEHTAPPGPGTYRISESVRYNEEHGAPESTLSVDVEFTLESV